MYWKQSAKEYYRCHTNNIILRTIPTDSLLTLTQSNAKYRVRCNEKNHTIHLNQTQSVIVILIRINKIANNFYKAYMNSNYITFQFLQYCALTGTNHIYTCAGMMSCCHAYKSGPSPLLASQQTFTHYPIIHFIYGSTRLEVYFAKSMIVSCLSFDVLIKRIWLWLMKTTRLDLHMHGQHSFTSFYQTYPVKRSLTESLTELNHLCGFSRLGTVQTTDYITHYFLKT